MGVTLGGGYKGGTASLLLTLVHARPGSAAHPPRMHLMVFTGTPLRLWRTVVSVPVISVSLFFSSCQQQLQCISCVYYTYIITICSIRSSYIYIDRCVYISKSDKNIQIRNI